MTTTSSTALKVAARVAHFQLQALAGDDVDQRRLDRLVQAVLEPVEDCAIARSLGVRLRMSFTMALVAVDIIDLAEAVASTDGVLQKIEAAWRESARSGPRRAEG